MRAKEPGAATLAVDGSGRDVDSILQVDLLVLAGAAGPSRLTAIDPRREIAVLVRPDVVLPSVAFQEALEVELHLCGRAHALR